MSNCLPNFLSLSVLPPPLLGGRGLVFTGVPHLRRPCLQQHLLPRLTAFACGNLCCRRRGPMERSALGRKLHLSLQRKGGSPTGFRLLRAVFSSQLCQLLTTMPPLENRNKHHQRYQKKDLRGFPTAISIDRSRRNLKQSPSFETGSGGWAKDNHQGDWALSPLSQPKYADVTRGQPSPT